MQDLTQVRRTMVDCQVRTFDVTDLRVLAAMYETPRELFVPPAQLSLAYSDQLIEVGTAGEGRARRWLLPPMVLARLLQALDVRKGDRVLDAGCATGYGTALLARLGARVIGLEPDPLLAADARAALRKLGIEVTVVDGAVAAGHPPAAPYDAILLNGAFEILPRSLLDQLGKDGRLVGIDAESGVPQAAVLRRSGHGVSRKSLFDCVAPVFEGLAKAPRFAF